MHLTSAPVNGRKRNAFGTLTGIEKGPLLNRLVVQARGKYFSTTPTPYFQQIMPQENPQQNRLAFAPSGPMKLVCSSMRITVALASKTSAST